MLLERSQAGSAVCVSKMAAKADSEEEEIHTTTTDEKLDAASELRKDTQTSISRKSSEAFEVDFGEPMPEKPAKNLQDAFKKFKKQRQVGSYFGVNVEVFRVFVLWISSSAEDLKCATNSCVCLLCLFVQI